MFGGFLKIKSSKSRNWVILNFRSLIYVPLNIPEVTSVLQIMTCGTVFTSKGIILTYWSVILKGWQNLATGSVDGGL